MTSPLDQIPRLAALLAETGLGTMELSGPSGRVFLGRSGSSAATPAIVDHVAASSPSPASAGGTVASPGVGTFRRTHPLHAQPMVEDGGCVAAGQVLGFLQVGALLQPVRAPSDGTLVAVHRADGTLTGFGDPLFDVLPN